MKKAIGYIRISDKDQSHFSISGQEKYIREYCEKNNIFLHSIFTDNGKSAKSFDRPDWKKMEGYIQKEFRNVDYLIVVKYDRFSRNAAEGLYKIEMLEKKYRIIIVSVFEQMSIDYDSPFYFKQRADMLVNAEFELHVIRDRTKFGMHTALSSGRYISNAPIGYLNKRDESKRPIIVIDEAKASYIRKLFYLFQQEVGIKAIFKHLKETGFPLKGNSAVTRILTNPVYAGLVKVPAYKKDHERLVKGIHEAYISESEYWDNQLKFAPDKKPARTVLNEEIPLRGVLKCFCGSPLTAGNSKGRSRYYWYYKCMKHINLNLSADKLHAQFDELLNNLSLSQHQLDYLYNSASKQMESSLDYQEKQLVPAKRDLASISNKLASLEEKFITNLINSETYQKWYNKYKTEESALTYQIETLSTDKSKFWTLFQEQLPKLGDIKYLFQKATLIQKQILIKMWFKSKLWYEGGVYRTTFLMAVFMPKAALLKEKRLLIFEKPLENSGKIPCVPLSGAHLNPNFIEFLQILEQINVA